MQFRAYIVFPRPQSTKQSAQIVCMTLKMASSCWILMSQELTRLSCWNSEAKCPWRNWGTWTWAWAKGEDRDGFEVECGAWTCSGWHQGVWGRWLERAAETGQGIVRMRAGNGEILKEKKRSLSRQTFRAWFLQVIFRDSCIATGIVGHWR